mmetsp:Transcript_112409/g.324736  ORF Transcript_112409/g.324736 Transcript_112409/m.324736 type:complete len:375 (-) Transcript_112409:240-1364(-)
MSGVVAVSGGSLASALRSLVVAAPVAARLPLMRSTLLGAAPTSQRRCFATAAATARDARLPDVLPPRGRLFGLGGEVERASALAAAPAWRRASDEWLVEYHFEELDSTQSFVEREYSGFDPTRLTVVSADFQTRGKGTRDRNWEAVRGQSVLVTFYFRFPLECSTSFVNRNAPNVTKVLSIALVDTLQWAVAASVPRPSVGLDLGIKWPNDVVANGQKIAGVVARAVVSEGRLESVIVGAGLNVNQTQADMDRIKRPVWPATSLKAVTGLSGGFDVAALRQQLAVNFADELRLFFAEGFAAFRERINAMDVLLRSEPAAREVRFRISERSEIEGEFAGVDEEGHIVIRTHDGRARSFPAGEIVLRSPEDSLRPT